MPQQHSPDTSPEEDNHGDAASLRTPTSIGPSKQEQSEKDEHDHVQKLQQDIARQEARDDSMITADAQLRLEEQQAVKQTRDDADPIVSGTREDKHDSALTEKASSLVKEAIAADQEDRHVDADIDDQMNGVKILPPKQDDISLNMQGQDATIKGNEVQSQDVSMTGLEPDENSVPRIAPISQLPAIDTAVADTPMTNVSSPALGSNDATPQKRPTPTPVQTAPRSTTRLSSGAIRHKSVSEILGETPKPASPLTEKTPTVPSFTEQPLTSSPVTAAPLTPGVLATLSNNQVRTGDRKIKDRSKLSAVVFTKPDNSGVVPIHGEYSQLAGISKDARRDYFQTMFVSQAYSPPRAQHLSELLSSANKVLTTSNRSAEFRENLDNRILRRVYHLQNANKWSLRQLERATEPSRPVTHLDRLLREMKWMRTDIKEERKWKMVMAKNLAHWCAQWVAANKEQRLDLQVRVGHTLSDSGSAVRVLPTEIAPDGDSTSTRNALVKGANTVEEDDDVEDIQQDISPQHTVAPAAVFSMHLEEFVFTLPETKSSNRLISDLPTFERGLDESTQKTSSFGQSVYILPVSKYVRGKVVAISTVSPKRRSRYDYDSDDDTVPEIKPEKLEDDLDAATAAALDLPPEQMEVGLFYPDNKILRDRLHAGQAFRPPSEFPMPSTTFYETRTSSHWLWDEDQKLRALVKDYTYNWSLISDALSMPTALISNPERRTPWECFERWVQLEGLPAEMSKMQYFRTYQARLDAAQRTAMAQQQAQQQLLVQQGNAAGIQTPLRRRTTVPIRVERRRSSRYLSAVDAMRKLARKREALAHKQQEGNRPF